jgi:hypothetical protein
MSLTLLVIVVAAVLLPRLLKLRRKMVEQPAG